MERMINIGERKAMIYDTDKTSLLNLLNEDIIWACIWDNYYVFQLKTDDNYDNIVYIVDKSTKKVEWGYYTSLYIIEDRFGKKISANELRRALNQ